LPRAPSTGLVITVALLLPIVLALLLGVGLSAQAGINASLRTVLGHPLHATAVSFLVGIAVVFGLALVAGLRTPTAEQWGRTTWWMYAGGVIGAIYVVGVVALAPRLGAATMMALVVTGQLAAALVLDHFGWLGFATHPISAPRILGGLLLVAGVVLVRRG